jgi:FeS assembly SUF system protein
MSKSGIAKIAIIATMAKIDVEAGLAIVPAIFGNLGNPGNLGNLMKPLPVITPELPASPESGSETAGLVPDAATTEALRPKIVEAIQTVYDPEIPVNIWELGLVYDIWVDAAGVAGVRMTLTAPGCPAAQSLPVEVASKVRAVPGITDVKVDVVWDPPWDKDRMSEAAKLQLGLW